MVNEGLSYSAYDQMACQGQGNPEEHKEQC